jgi:predicted nucleic acid-binding protein
LAGVTLDTGALIAYERGDRSVMVHLKEARLRRIDLTVPVVVLAEAWRGGSRSAKTAMLLAGCIVEPMREPLARAAGEALAKVKGTVIDAVVMASAASRGDTVLTSDYDDLERLRVVFPSVGLAPL